MQSSYDRAGCRRPAWSVLILCVALWSCAQERAPAQVTSTTQREATRVASSEQPSERAASGPLVVFLGDSLSAGLHLPADQAFPALVQQKLAREGTPFRLVNAGVSGDTTAGGLSRVAWILKQRPRLVVLELGTNDGLRGMPLAFVEQNLRAIIRKIREQKAEVLFLGMRLPPSIGVEYADAFALLYERVAKETGVSYVPFFHEGVAGVPELNLPDGLHPTEEGHRRIAEKLAPHLREALRKLEPLP